MSWFKVWKTSSCNFLWDPRYSPLALDGDTNPKLMRREEKPIYIHLVADSWLDSLFINLGGPKCIRLKYTQGVNLPDYPLTRYSFQSWWRHQTETFSALLALYAGNLPVPGELPSQSPVAQSFDVFFDRCMNKRLSKQWWGWWFETPSHPLWCHCNGVEARRSQNTWPGKGNCLTSKMSRVVLT